MIWAITIPGGYYIWRLSFRGFVIFTREITGIYIYLQHPKKFAGVKTIPGGYYIWLVSFIPFVILTFVILTFVILTFVILTERNEGVYIYLQHNNFAGVITIPGGYYSWLLSFRPFAIISGKNYRWPTQLTKLQIFAASITIPCGYSSGYYPLELLWSSLEELQVATSNYNTPKSLQVL